MSRRQPMSSGERTTVVLFIAAVALFFLIPLLIAAIFYTAARAVMARRGWTTDRMGLVLVLIVALAAAASLAYWGDALVYTLWMGGIVGLSDTPMSAVPVSLIIATSVVLATLAMLLESTTVMSWSSRLFPRARHDRPSIVPDAKDRKKLSNVTLPPGRVLPVPGSGGRNTMDNSVPLESRLVSIGWGADRSTVAFTVKEMSTHMLILGSTGSGKSVTLMTIAAGLADQGMSGLVIDHKEDTKPGGLRDFLAGYAQHHGLQFQELRLSNENSETWFNPISQMGPDEMRDTILALMRFDDEYWQNLSKDLLTQLVNLLYLAHQAAPDQVPAPTLYEIGRLLKQGSKMAQATMKYRALIKAAFPAVDDSDFATIINIQPDEQKNAVGFGSKITQLYGTQAGRAVLRDGENASGVLKAELDVTDNGLVYIGLDNQGKPDLTKAISAAVLKKLNVYAAQRTTGALNASVPRFVIVDEASVVNREIVKDLLARARSAGIITILATQGPRDWIDEQGDDWNEMLNNVNVLLIMRMNDPASAEMCAEAIGQELRREVTQRVVDGYVVKDGAIREKLDYRVMPDQIRSLQMGEGVLRTGVPERCEFVKIAMRSATS